MTDMDVRLEKLQRRLVHKCQAVDIPSLPCGDSASGYYRTICSDSHIRDFWLCTTHAQVRQGWCGPCYRDQRDPHACHLTVMGLTMGTDGWQPLA